MYLFCKKPKTFQYKIRKYWVKTEITILCKNHKTFDNKTFFHSISRMAMHAACSYKRSVWIYLQVECNKVMHKYIYVFISTILWILKCDRMNNIMVFQQALISVVQNLAKPISVNKFDVLIRALNIRHLGYYTQF